jgi:hypothetical protein
MFQFAVPVVLTLVTACSGKKETAANVQPATCDAQAKRYGELLASTFAKQGIPGGETRLPAALVAACKDDHWPDSAARCLSAVKPGKERDMEACIHALSPELQEKMETRVKVEMSSLAR